MAHRLFRRTPLLALFGLLVAAIVLQLPASAGASPATGAAKFKQTVPVNVVFIGYSPQMVNQGKFLKALPATYAPVVREPQFYGLSGRNVGLKFAFKYRTIFAGQALEGSFFKYLTAIGTPGDLTQYQQAYNDELNNVLDVTGPVLYIDGPSVEKWLEKAAATSLGIDTRHSYTIFFVDWYRHPGFKFHVYTKTDMTDPDTGYNFGTERDSRKMIAWGGSSGRTWFYDLSAGPEAWTDNWDVDNADVDGDGVADYRMPPIWEYAAGGYRAPSKLTSDLGLIARFVGIDCLFTTSPLYDPLVTAPGLSGAKVDNIQMFEDDPASSGPAWIHMAYIKNTLRSFEPYYKWTVALKDENPIDADAQHSFRVWADIVSDPDSYWSPYGTTFAELFGYFDANQGRYVPPYGPTDYVGKVFAFNTTDESMGDEFGLLGYSDDNWTDGTQSYVFAFDTAGYRDLGYGFSTTAAHEFGHHIGMSHPHDGYDAEQALDFDSIGATYFAWSGDESNTIMAYNDVSAGFGQFDRDNMGRYEFAGYANWTSTLLAEIQADPDHWKVAGLTGKAASLRNLAIKQFGGWDYPPAASNAYAGYQTALRAATILGVDTSAATPLRAMAAAAGVPHEGDPIRFPNN